MTESDVARLLSLRDCLQLQDQVFTAHRRSRGGSSSKMQRSLPGGSGSFSMMSCLVPELTTFTCKVISVLRAVPSKAGRRTNSSLMLFDQASGRRIAVIASVHLTALRTAASACLAARYIARRDSRSVGIYGSGTIAALILEGLTLVTQVDEARVYSPTRTNREDFAVRLGERLGIPIDAVSDPALPSRSDVVVAATTSLSPVLRADWVQPGTTLLSVSSRADLAELPGAVFEGSRVLTDSHEGALNESGDVREAVREGFIARADQVIELADVIGSTESLRRTTEEVWVYKGTGLAIQDAFAADFVYRRALAEGVGAWFDFDA